MMFVIFQFLLYKLIHDKTQTGSYTVYSKFWLVLMTIKATITVELWVIT